MSGGEIFTRLTIWITIAGYAAGTAAFALSRKRSGWDSFARQAWTVAFVSLLAHVACAFHFYHGWSHEAAYRDTARQTAEAFSFNWGGGLYLNYALVILWLLDVSWWWLRGLDGYRRRHWPLVATWHAFLMFMIFNGVVVFNSGPRRWLGLCVCLGVCFVWLLAARDNSDPTKSWTR